MVINQISVILPITRRLNVGTATPISLNFFNREDNASFGMRDTRTCKNAPMNAAESVRSSVCILELDDS
jgi:hypothetical protein